MIDPTKFSITRVASSLPGFYTFTMDHIKTLAERVDTHLLIASWCEDEADAAKHTALAIKAYEFLADFSKEFDNL